MSKSMWSGMFWGILVGAGAAILFAPQSGQVTRESLKIRSMAARDRASRAASTASQKAQYMSEKIKQAI